MSIIKTEGSSLFKDSDSGARCAGCERQEPKDPMPGWPLQGRFLVIGKAKLCSSCAGEVLKKISAISEHQRFTGGNL